MFGARFTDLLEDKYLTINFNFNFSLTAESKFASVVFILKDGDYEIGKFCSQ